MLKYIKSQYTRLWNNPYRYYDAIDPDLMSYFGVMTFFSTIFGLFLAGVGIGKLTDNNVLTSLPEWAAIVMIVLGVISIATCIIYGVLSDYLAEEWNIDTYDPKKVLIIVDTTIMQLCSGFFIVLLAIGIVIETFTILLYSLPLMIIKAITNKEPKVSKAERLKREFLSYK
jgi:membrane-anchored glycerophosphoryl diester phosphodiesterase (GDPDase)